MARNRDYCHSPDICHLCPRRRATRVNMQFRDRKLRLQQALSAQRQRYRWMVWIVHARSGHNPDLLSYVEVGAVKDASEEPEQQESHQRTGLPAASNLHRDKRSCTFEQREREKSGPCHSRRGTRQGRQRRSFTYTCRARVERERRSTRLCTHTCVRL